MQTDHYGEPKVIRALSGDPVPAQTSGKTIAATITTPIMTAIAAFLLKYTGLDLAADPEINGALEILVTAVVAAATAGVSTYYKRNFLK